MATPLQLVPARQEPIRNTLALVREWDQFLAAQGRSAATRRGYRYAVLRFLSEACPADLGELTEADAAQFAASFRGPAQRAYLLGMRSFFAWAHRRQHLHADITAAFRPKKPPRPEPAALSREELARVVYAAACRDPRRAWGLILTYAVGARRMEVAGIRPQDVDLENRTVDLVQTKGGRPRRIELGSLALAALEGLRPWGERTVLGVLAPTVTGWMNKAARDAGLPPKKHRLHVLRATFATNLLAAGTPISVVSRMLGHSDLAVTTWYLAMDEDDRRQAVERL